MTETINHIPPEPRPEVVPEGDDPEFDSHVNWKIGDRLLILMSLVLTKRLIAYTPKIPFAIKTRMMERMSLLIERFRHPSDHQQQQQQSREQDIW